MAPHSSRAPLVIAVVAGIACVGGLLLLVLAVAVGGVAFWSTSAPDREPAASSGTGQITTPPGVAADQPYLEVGSSESGPVVDVYVDFLCPHCATFHEAQGADLQRMAEAGEITLRMHPRPMLDASSTPAGYSGRAANAAVCAYAQDPAQWFAAESALFTDQPDASGLDDTELITRISEATGLDVSDCVASSTYLPWIQDVVETEALSTGQGTPAVFIDGEQFTGDISAPGSLAEAIAAG